MRGRIVLNNGNYGERKESESRDWGYWAHLSIYKFASQYFKRGDFLEIGCGTGYGANWLFQQGVKSYTAIDKDQGTIEALKKLHPKINFFAIDLDLSPLPFEEKRKFDFLFSSNVFEHIAYIDPVIDQLRRILKKDAIAVIAIPPIITPGMLHENAKNLFHINNIPPWSWEKKLKRYFKDVEYFRHWVVPSKINLDGTINMNCPNLDDFVFTQDFDYLPSTITSVFLCKNPLEISIVCSGQEDWPIEWRGLKVSADARQSEFVRLSKELENANDYWKNEVDDLYEWVINNEMRGTDKSEIICAIKNHLSMLLGKSFKNV